MPPPPFQAKLAARLKPLHREREDIIGLDAAGRFGRCPGHFAPKSRIPNVIIVIQCHPGMRIGTGVVTPVTLMTLLSPVSDGRDGKCVVKVYDYIDAHVPALARMYQRRLKGYAALGYTIAPAETESLLSLSFEPEERAEFQGWSSP